MCKKHVYFIFRFIVLHDTSSLLLLQKKEERNLTKTFICHVCKAVFKYMKSRDLHERKKHQYNRGYGAIEISEEKEEGEKDHLFMYQQGLLTLNLLIRNINDCIKEGGFKVNIFTELSSINAVLLTLSKIYVFPLTL